MKRFLLVLTFVLLLAACSQNRHVDISIGVQCYEGEPCVTVDNAGFDIVMVTPTVPVVLNCAPTVQASAIGPFPQPPQPCENLP